MQSSKDQQGEIRKPSSAMDAKKQRKNNRMGKTRDLFKKITDTKGTFYAKMGSIKDRDILGYRKSSLSPKGNILQKKRCYL